jgi:uncharacterized protein YbaR (Trm112 family)
MAAQMSSSRVRALANFAGDALQNVRAARGTAARHSPSPPGVGLVLDVGVGQSADPRADIVVDKYVTDDFERGSPLDLSKPLVVADGHALPFAAGSFAYVTASHVLEHATDPPSFAGELTRVAKAGFVQVPTREAELTFGWPFHPWLIDRDGDTLIFHPRDGQQAPMGEMFHRFYADSPQFQMWFHANRDVWHHSVNWVGELSVEVHGASAAEKTATLDIERTLEILPRMGARSPAGAVRDALRCPADEGGMSAAADRLVCDRCERSYPVAGGIPVLLSEAAV